MLSPGLAESARSGSHGWQVKSEGLCGFAGVGLLVLVRGVGRLRVLHAASCRLVAWSKSWAVQRHGVRLVTPKVSVVQKKPTKVV